MPHKVGSGLGTGFSIPDQGWAAVILEPHEAGSQAAAMLQGQRPAGQEGWEGRRSLDQTKGELLRSKSRLPLTPCDLTPTNSLVRSSVAWGGSSALFVSNFLTEDSDSEWER